MPVESLIRERQQDYYKVLGACDRVGNSTAFVEFGAAIVEEALEGFLQNLRAEPTTPSHRVEIAVRHFESREFSKKDYASLFPGISPATASRDLRHGVDSGLLVKSGDKALTRYRVAYLRMRRAADLLTTTDDKVETIANAIGYESPFTFSNAFKRWTGRRPTDYRNAGKGA